MAESLNAFTQEFSTIKQAAETRGGFAVDYQRKHIQWKSAQKQQLNDIRARAKALKGAGKNANQLRQDSEIRAIELQLHALDRDVEQTKIFVKSWGAPTAERLRTLETRMTAEIAKRRKEVTTKLGLGNKSLPGMEALLVEVKRFKTSARYKAMTGLKPVDYNAWQIAIERDVLHEIEAGLAGK